ncbi:centrosomal protein of 57 kDa [Biomphalaria glabrata]|nr:centrosomal protein of 57 kDa [Biomphalaria glabrata]
MQPSTQSQGFHSTADPNLKSVSSKASNNLDQYYLASKETAPTLTSRGHYQLYHHGTMDLDVGGDRGDTLTTRYIGYPATKPFINTDFEREDRPVNSYPTTNRDDVISALKSLQSKMHKLEIDRRISEQALLTLTSDTEKFKEHLNIGGQTSGGGVGRSYRLPADPQTEDEIADKHAQELRDQLLDTENRCQMLGKQLENMKSMTLTSQRNGWDFKEKTYRSGPDGELKYHIDRLNELERDQARLTTTQSLAERYSGNRTDHSERKIQELETKLKEEKRHRKVLQEKTMQLETATASNVKVTRDSTQPLPRPHSSPAQLPKTKKVIKKKKKKPLSSRSAPVKLEPTRHFRLNLAEVPFVAGKSTGPSHSLVANVQKVLSMMKTHNPALCSMYANVDNQLTDSSPSSGSSSASIDQDLNDLIKQLQDEYGQLASESHRLLDEIHTMRDLHAREELEKEYEAVVAKMKSKRDQISKIMKHQQKLSKVTKEHSTGVKQTERLKRPHSHPCRPISSLTKHFQKNGSVSSHPPAACSKTKASNSAPVNPALYMLRDMKKLQTTLRRDDLSWD